MGQKETLGAGCSWVSFLSLQASHPSPDILHSRLVLLCDEDISIDSQLSVSVTETNEMLSLFYGLLPVWSSLFCASSKG